MALTKVIGAGLGTLTEDQVLGGATPTLTIGDAGAEDAKIVFDGNAQDYHIGLDDSADTLVIGKGSALGTTTAMSFDANGIITKPLQPAFLAQPSSIQSNIVTGQSVTLTFATERFDQNSDYNTSNSNFTAPVAGKYHLETCIRTQVVDTAAEYYNFEIVTTNRGYQNIIDPNFSADVVYWTIVITALADMDAGDTAYVRVRQQGGTQQTDFETPSHFSGFLAC